MNSTHKNEPPNNQCILVTDSGLGGLSVFNNIANRLAHESPWQSIRLVYFNAWPAPHRGYNHFKTKLKRVQIFNNALLSMLDFNPDQILIACNTLSVIYPYTEFFKLSGPPVEGIVDHGVKLFYENLVADPKSVAVILGTPTTIEAKSHETQLTGLGIEPDRIINVGCTNLAGWIEREPFAKEVDQMIKQFAKETREKLGNFSGNIYVGLCCTHFGYKKALFKEAFNQFVSKKVTFLDPNIRLAGKIFETGQKQGSFSPQIDMKIVSKAKWANEQIDAYQKLIPDMSKAVQHALKNYSLNTELFSVD